MHSIEYQHPYRMLQRNATEFANSPAIQGQKLGQRQSEELFGLSWAEALQRVNAYANYFRSLGLKKGDRVAIQARNQMGWALSDWAMSACGLVSVPIYVQSVAREVKYILEEAEIKLLLCEEPNPESPVKQIRLIDLDQEAQKYLGEQFIEDLLGPDEIATIIYTSGTTGEPKGVLHSFRNLSTAIQIGMKWLGISKSDQLLSYLPLSHIAERVLCDFLPLYSGSSVAFVESAEKVSRALPSVRPTVFLAVPRVWDMMRLKIQKELSSNAMVEARLQLIPRFLRKWILGYFIRNKLGFSRTRYFFSGAAKLSNETAQFFRDYGIQIAELYGLTETLGVSIFSNPKRPVLGSVGQPYPSVELKFLEDGELCLKAPFHFLGYYRKPDETKAVMKEGWFHTGDIGHQDQNGNIFITDRKKDIFKTANGKYVAPLPIETRLKAHPAIREVMVVGENRPHCVAIASIEEKLANVEDLMRHLENVNASLPIHEKIKTIGCVTRSWSVDAGELTPTMKLKRRQLLVRYSEEIEGLFKARRPVEFIETGNERNIRAHSGFKR